jgi:hypothetical protein
MFAYGWKLRADSCLLQVGSNDLCQLDKSFKDIEQKLIGLVLTSKYCYHVQRVAVWPDFTSAMA